MIFNVPKTDQMLYIGVWSKERNIFHITDTDTVALNCAALGISATYSADASGVVYIDASELLRLANTGVLVLTCNDGDAVVTVTYNWITRGLISPESVFILATRSGLLMEPPTVMFEPFGGVQVQTEVCALPGQGGAYGVRIDEGDVFREISHTQDANLESFTVGSGQTAIASSGYGVSEIRVQFSGMEPAWYRYVSDQAGDEFPFAWIGSSGYAYSKTRDPETGEEICDDPDGYGERTQVSARRMDGAVAYPFRPLACDVRYVWVRWVSFTGNTRCHVFQVVKINTSVKESVSLLTMGNDYDIRKGRVDGFTLRLPDLGAFDYWYYSDVCFSSDVEISQNGQTWERVQVTTEAQTYPDGIITSALEISVNYKHFDIL